jgi:hypothetical protein
MQSTPSARFCANCGVQLFKPSFDAGHCISCGYAIADTISAEEALAASGQQPRPASSNVSIASSGNEGLSTDERLTDPDQTYGQHDQSPRKRRNGAIGWVFLPIFLAIIAASILILLHIVPPLSTSSSMIGGGHTPNPMATMAPIGGTPIPGVGVTPGPTSIPGSTPPPGKGTAVPTAPPTAVTGPTATPPPGAPPSIQLSQITFRQAVCLNSSVTFTITNGGGGVLNFQVSASSLLQYTINPTSGSLSAGEGTQVSVTHINLSGTITVSASGIADVQTITIKCL